MDKILFDQTGLLDEGARVTVRGAHILTTPTDRDDALIQILSLGHAAVEKLTHGSGTHKVTALEPSMMNRTSTRFKNSVSWRVNGEKDQQMRTSLDDVLLNVMFDGYRSSQLNMESSDKALKTQLDMALNEDVSVKAFVRAISKAKDVDLSFVGSTMRGLYRLPMYRLPTNAPRPPPFAVVRTDCYHIGVTKLHTTAMADKVRMLSQYDFGDDAALRLAMLAPLPHGMGADEDGP